MRRTRQVRFVMAAVAAGALAAAMPNAGGAQTTSQAMRVGESRRFGESTDPVRGRDAPAMAVNPSDPRHIVLVDQDMLIGQCDFHTTFDGGRTWTDGHLTAPPGFTTPPCPTFDTGGYTHANQSVAFGSGLNVYTTFSSQLVPATLWLAWV